MGFGTLVVTNGQLMKQASDRVCKLIEPIVTSMGYEPVGIEFDARVRVLRIYIDKPEGITVDDCSDVSYQVSGVLDVEDPIPGNYHLEVSSPGLDRPLTKKEHFARFAGETVRLHTRTVLNGRRHFKGLLRGLENEQVLLEAEGETFAIPFESVESARLAPEFPVAAKGKRHGK